MTSEEDLESQNRSELCGWKETHHQEVLNSPGSLGHARVVFWKLVTLKTLLAGQGRRTSRVGSGTFKSTWWDFINSTGPSHGIWTPEVLLN